LLPLPYCHLVFTLPHALNGLAQCHDRWVYRTLMQCVAATLSDFAANPRWLGATGAFTLVLHTWTQDLRRHIHVHALMACGGLDDGGRWCAPTRSPTFLFPVHALSKVYRGKFLDALRHAIHAGELPRDPASTEVARRQRLKQLLRHGWVVYAKTPLAGPEMVLDYLSRYTHRVAVSNERIVGIDARSVRLRVRADDHGGRRTVLIDGPTFIERFVQHVLPPGFKRTVHHLFRCRRRSGGADRTQPCEHAAGAHLARHRWTTRPVHAPARPRAKRRLTMPIARIGHASGV
jgi:hypothetical protein